jgi:hypothetical protein
MLLSLVGAACTGSDQAVPSTTTPSEPIEFETLPPVAEVVTTEVGTGPSPDSLPLATPIEPVLATIDGPIPASVEAFSFAAPSVVDFAGLPLTDIAVSPSDRWIAINRQTEICLLDPSIGSESSDEGCVDFAGSIAPGSLAWSPDESAVAFAHDWPQEPDIGVLDVASQSFAVLTEDGAETAGFDVAPFYSEDGTLHFLRSGPDPFSFNIIEFGDTPITLGSLEAEGFPSSARRDPVGGIIIVEVGGARFTSIETIDLVEGTSTLIGGEIDSINRRPFLDVIDGRALVGQNSIPEVNGIRAALIDLRGDALPRALPSMPAGSGRGVVGVGLSPDGTAIMMIIADVTDPLGHQLVVAPILDDGSVGPLSVIATGEQFAPNNGDKTIRPHGLGVQQEIIWTSDKIVFGLGPNQIVTLDLGS